jgi:hypothetical protein
LICFNYSMKMDPLRNKKIGLEVKGLDLSAD